MSYPRVERTVTVTATESVVHTEEPPSVTLLLRPTEENEEGVRPRLRWAETTVDNEFMGKRSSKKCCIFHKRRAFNEDSSSEEEGGGREDSAGDGGGEGPGGESSGKSSSGDMLAGGGEAGKSSDGGGERTGEQVNPVLPGLKRPHKKRGGAEGGSSEVDLANCPHCQYLQKLKAERSE